MTRAFQSKNKEYVTCIRNKCEKKIHNISIHNYFLQVNVSQILRTTQIQSKIVSNFNVPWKEMISLKTKNRNTKFTISHSSGSMCFNYHSLNWNLTKH